MRALLAWAALLAAGLRPCPAGAGAPPPRFTDVSAASGLPLSGPTTGVVLFDVNGDSLPDLLLGRHAGAPEAYVNRGGLRFENDVTWGRRFEVSDHHATVAADVDGDGRTDLYFVSGAERGRGCKTNSLYLSSDGYAADASAAWGVGDPFGRGRGGLCVPAGEGGALDLLVLNWRTALRAFALGGELPAPDRAEQLFGARPAQDDSVALRYAAGDSVGGRYRDEFVTGLLPQDLDRDGRADFLALGVPPALLLRLERGRYLPDLPAFPEVACVPEPKDGAWGDFDGDGRADLYVVYGEDDAPSHFAAVRRNRLLLWRDGRLLDQDSDALAMGGHGVACASGDVDDDGDLDLVVLQGDRAARRCRVVVALNDGRGRFSPPREVGGGAIGGIAEALLVADLDGDGDLDVLVTVGAVAAGVHDGGVRLLRNDSDDGSSLSVAPLENGRPAFGARVELRRPAATQVRQCWPAQVGGSSFAIPVHLGLGGDREADLTVVWPSGGRTRLSGVRAGRALTVRHP